MNSTQIRELEPTGAETQPETGNDLESVLQLMLDLDEVDSAWMDDAPCAQTDPEAFFPDKGGSTSAAKAVCAKCPVRQQCLDYAIAHHVPSGIWGGLSPRERRALVNATDTQDGTAA